MAIMVRCRPQARSRAFTASLVTRPSRTSVAVLSLTMIISVARSPTVNAVPAESSLRTPDPGCFHFIGDGHALAQGGAAGVHLADELGQYRNLEHTGHLERGVGIDRHLLARPKGVDIHAHGAVE